MSDQRMPFSRRKFLATTALGAAAATGSLAMPSVLRAQGAGVKVGILHPVSGALSYSGQQGRLGATMAIEEINAAGGIKGMGGAKIDPVLGDAQSTPEGGTAEVEKMNSAGVACIVGGYASIDMPCHDPDRGALRSALHRRRRRHRRHRHPRPEEYVPLRSRIWRDRQDRAGEPRRDQRQSRQAGQDRDDRARGFSVRLRSRQAAQRAAAAATVSRCWRPSRIRRRRAISTTSCSRSRRRPRTSSFRPTITTNMCCSRAPCSSRRCGRRRRSTPCSAARRPPTNSSRNSRRRRSTSWIAITGSIRAIRKRRP